MGSQIDVGTGPGRQRLFGFAVLAVAALAGMLLVSSATAGWWGRHGGHGRGGGWLSDPAEAREHAQFAAEWVLRKVDATTEQKEKVGVVVGKLVDDMAPLAERHRENREQWIEALSGDTVDRATLDRLRQSELELASAASTHLVDAFAEIGAILDAEQRRELLEHLKHHRRRRHG